MAGCSMKTGRGRSGSGRRAGAGGGGGSQGSRKSSRLRRWMRVHTRGAGAGGELRRELSTQMPTKDGYVWSDLLRFAHDGCVSRCGYLQLLDAIDGVISRSASASYSVRRAL